MGSPFTLLVTKVLDVPCDQVNSITIRKLNPDQLSDARKAAQREVIDAIKATLAELTSSDGGVPEGFVRALMADQAKTPEPPPAEPVAAEASEPPPAPATAPIAPSPAVDPLAQYDQHTLIQYGVIGWTYELEKSAANYRELDEETREWLAREVLKLAKPALFADPEELRKND